MATPNDLWPNRNVKATVVDTDPPQSSGWSDWSPNESSQSAWSTSKKKLQRTPRRTSPTTQPATAPGRRVGRWIAAAALWTLAGGLFAGRMIAADVDAGVEVGMDWLAVRGPSFLRPYLPKPVPKLIEPRPHKQPAVSPVFPDRSTPKETANAAPKEDRGRRHR
jgi:hypothetical protein